MEFEVQIDAWVTAAKGDVRKVIRKIALTMFRRVILRSPVDTGRFRGNWQVAIGNAPDGVLDLTDPSGAATISKATAVAMKLEPGDIIWLVNNLPYAIPLEHGHSKQAPAGMVGITVVEFADAAGQAAREVRQSS